MREPTVFKDPENSVITVSTKNVISGRGFIATRDLEAGENILNDTSLGAVFTESNLVFRTNKGDALLPCIRYL